MEPIDEDELDELIQGAIKRALYRTALDMQRIMVETLISRYVPNGYRTGDLARSITIQENENGFIVGTNLNMAVFVETGTGIYGGKGAPMPLAIDGLTFPGKPITPKNGNALKFTVNKVVMRGKRASVQGNVVFAKSVKGQKGKWFMHEALKQLPERLEANLADELSKLSS